jgi:two-component system sensor histidine kinase MprB
LAAAIAVAVAVVLVAGITYFVVRSELRGQVDSALRAQAIAIEKNYVLGRPLPVIPPSEGGPAQYAQLVLADGTPYPIEGGLQWPPTSRVTSVASGNSPPFMTDVTIAGSHLREFTFALPGPISGQGAAIQLARPLSSIDNVLSTLRLILLLLVLVGVGLAVVLGRLAAKRVLAPLAEVAATAQHISQTEDLSSRINVHTDDEVGQLAHRFNAMLERLEASRDALDESVRAQRQLVADASHELRTPVTSLRTNIELLLEHEQLDPDLRQRMLADVVGQTEELSALVGDLIDLARGDLPADSVEDVRLDQIVGDSVRRAERNFPQTTFKPTTSPVLIEGLPDRLSRAVNNLLDNAARHSPPGGLVEITVDDQGVQVRDHGPGVAESDLPYVFDRFYRGVGARGTQGSGLGLSIVSQVAEQHGGSVSVENAPDGGAVFRLRLPVGRPEAPQPPSGSGWLGDSRLAGDPEPLAEEPEADGEQRDDRGKQRTPAQRAAD